MQKQKHIFLAALLLWSGLAQAQQLSKNEFSVNGFRNPSIGVEYRHKAVSIHSGYYITALEAGITTKFIKTGVTVWFKPTGKKENPSSFYAGASYLRGLNLDYKKQNAMGLEAGYRWMIYKGLNFRIGGIALLAKDHKTKFNPTPGLSYSFFF